MNGPTNRLTPAYWSGLDDRNLQKKRENELVDRYVQAVVEGIEESTEFRIELIEQDAVDRNVDLRTLRARAYRIVQQTMQEKEAALAQKHEKIRTLQSKNRKLLTIILMTCASAVGIASSIVLPSLIPISKGKYHTVDPLDEHENEVEEPKFVPEDWDPPSSSEDDPKGWRFPPRIVPGYPDHAP